MTSLFPLKVRREGWPFIAILAVATLGLFTLSPSLGWLGVIVTGWCVYFFRDPDRVTPLGENLVISPADGVVLPIEHALPPAELDMGDTPLKRISIFMNVFDVHVNRMPVEAAITRIAYHKGKFFNASLDKASIHNERNAILLKTPDGSELAVVQVAGLIARRILCWAETGTTLKAGQRFGMIRFGSRLDIYLPPGASVAVVPGQRSIGGETVIGELNSDTPNRTGERR